MNRSQIWKIIVDNLVNILGTLALAALLLGVRFIRENSTVLLSVLVVGLGALLAWNILRGQPWLTVYLTRFRRIHTGQVRMLVRHTDRLYFAFAAVRERSELGGMVEDMLWRWHWEASCYCNLFLARDPRRGPKRQKRALDFICVNRHEYLGLDNEPVNTLISVSKDAAATEDVRKHALAWLAKLGGSPEAR